MSCSGRCYVQFSCECKCFEDCDCDYDAECSCDHLDSCSYLSDPRHNQCVIYCKFANTCCSLFKCSNHFVCKNEIPKFVFERNNGVCDGCYFQFGSLKKSEKKEECGICMDELVSVELECKHSMCQTCLENWFEESEDRSCPYCRKIN